MMRPKNIKKQKKFRSEKRYSNACYSLILLAMLFLFSGCTGKGDMRFSPLPDSEHFALAGQIKLPEIVETDLAGSLRQALTSITDFSAFKVSAGGVSARPDKLGNFSLSKVPFQKNW